MRGLPKKKHLVLLTLLVPVFLAALMSANSWAGTATLNGDTFSYKAAPGEQNYLIVDVTGSCEGLGVSSCLFLSDSANLVITPPPGCANGQFFSAFTIYCPLPTSVTIDAGDGNDTVLDWNGPSKIDGGPGDDDIFGHGGNDTITGGQGSDVLIGGSDDDAIDGGPGNDLMEAPISGYGIQEEPSEADSAGADVLHGGTGLDTVSYLLRTDSLVISLDGRANDGGPGESDTIGDDVESVITGSGNDVLTGSDRADGLYGTSGDDRIRGGAGDDTLDGGPGSDEVLGEDGADTVSGGHDDDVVDGGPGHDNIYGEYAVGCDGLYTCLGGPDVIRARDGERDLISCGVGTDRAQIDPFDVVRDIPGSTECEQLDIPKGAAGGAAPASLKKALARCKSLRGRSARAACKRRVLARTKRG